MDNIIEFDKLSTSALIPGNIYKGGNKGNVGDNPFTSLLGVGNSGGMRPKVNRNKKLAYIVLISNPSNQHEYPDEFDSSNNLLIYYGDQRKPGKHFSETKHKGNINVKKLFEESYTNNSKQLFPCFYFEKIEGKGRNYKYIGLAYPFVRNKNLEEVCQNLSIHSQNGIVNNYKFLFTIDSKTIVTREWLNFLVNNQGDIKKCVPASWIKFIEDRSIELISDTDSNSLYKDYLEEESEIYSTGNKKRTVNSRNGQSLLRNAVLKKYGKCQLCDINYQELLIASHIIPWNESDSEEIIKRFGENTRGDVDNILLLCANHDRLFDRNLISFDDTGRILISNKINKEDYELLGINDEMKIEMNDRQRRYMELHRNSLNI
ncbi:HNH endonuclease [Enterococcus faecalis]